MTATTLHQPTRGRLLASLKRAPGTAGLPVCMPSSLRVPPTGRQGYSLGSLPWSPPHGNNPKASPLRQFPCLARGSRWSSENPEIHMRTAWGKRQLEGTGLACGKDDYPRGKKPPEQGLTLHNWIFFFSDKGLSRVAQAGLKFLM